VILVAFFLPLAGYLLFLGFLNGRRRPVLVSGTWDLIGLLFAGSGFLLFGGPAILTGLNERWRMFWLFGEGDFGEGGSGWHFWVLLWALYYAAVVAGTAYLFRRRRARTCVYNVEPSALVGTLGEVCDRLGLGPVRSGNLFLFGMNAVAPPGRRATHAEAIQAPPYHGPGPHLEVAAGPKDSPADDRLGCAAVLEVDSFPALAHATLSWDPPSAPLRREVEAELERRLRATPAPDHDTGAWLTLVGLTLLAGSLLGVVFLVLRALLGR
jgi:hypothetical protein